MSTQGAPPDTLRHDRDRGVSLLDSDRAYAALRGDILMGVHPPGGALRLSDLRQRYRIGPSPLREALFRLTSQRLVKQESNRGFRVPPLHPAEWADVVATRRHLEPAAAAASVAAGDEAWEETLILAHRRLGRLGSVSTLLEDPADSASIARWEAAHRGFHRALIAACGSAWTLNFCDLLADQFDRYRRFFPPSRAVQDTLGAQHDALLQAALDRDAKTFREMLESHVEITGRAVEAGLASGDIARCVHTTVPPSTSKS